MSIGLTSAHALMSISHDEGLIGCGDLTYGVSLVEIFLGKDTFLEVFGVTTEGLGLAERMSMSGPIARILSPREALLEAGCDLAFLAFVSPSCHGGVPAT